MNYKDMAERLVWTVIAAALTNLGSVGLLGIEAWKAAALAGINGGVSFVLIVARQRLAVLPDPGAGLPGLTVKDDKGQSWVAFVAVIALVLAVALAAGWIAPH